ncbi:MAG: hypothetical protein K2X50_06695 [Gammaproteobacteria bacterium]|nr:hypothetical protein [Gammaproteobacteria bacterium]
MTNRLSHLRWEIAAALVLKVALLWLLWKLCFSHSLTHSVNNKTTTQHLLIDRNYIGDHDGP